MKHSVSSRDICTSKSHFLRAAGMPHRGMEEAICRAESAIGPPRILPDTAAQNVK
jgi:hypothetical protein